MRLSLPIFAACVPLLAQNPEAAGLLDRIAAQEREFVERLRPLQPVLEAYLQEVSEAGVLQADHYLLGKLDLRNGPEHLTYLASPAFQKPSRKKAPPLVLAPAGFAQMVVPDADDFNRETYRFDYVRREFLGELRCLVIDVAPHDPKAVGRFLGRIWVEDQDHRIVRFNGTYTHSNKTAMFFHFDSWRVPVAPGWYAPAFVYIEDARPVRLKGQMRLWGYQTARSRRWGELTNVRIEAEAPVRDQAAAPDWSPVESQRAWARQAEENVLDKLERSGLLAPKGDVEQVLNTVVNNLVVTSELNLEAQCRVLLTTPLETFSIGRTIVISRGLLDVLPDEASLAMVLSDELAHIALGHRTETMFAFSDRTIFSEEEILRRLRFARSPEEIEAAGKRAVEILAKSPYRDKLAQAGLFLKALASRAPRLTHLIAANVGNRLAGGSNLVRLGELAQAAPPLEENKLDQIAALPLGSRVRLDPWTNQISLIKAKPVALLSPREKMPFEVTPVVLHLTRVAAGSETAKAGPTPLSGKQ
jgi:hypothetical protein